MGELDWLPPKVRDVVANDVLSRPDGVDGEAARNDAPPPLPFVPRHSRRLSDKLLIAFHHACDVQDFEIADQLLRLLETMNRRQPRPEDGSRRRAVEGLVAGHERLWHLRHPDRE